MFPLLALLVALFDPAQTPPPAPAPAPAVAPAPAPAPATTPDGVRVAVTTNAGTMTFRLLPDVAPTTVAQFLDLVKAKIYDGIYFYRVEEHFVAQIATHDDRRTPLTRAQLSHITPIPLEVSPDVLHHRGVLSLAHGDDPNSGESSFSILLGDAPHLDGKYTIFGTMVAGDDVLRGIEARFNHDARDADGIRLEVLKIEVVE